VDSARARLIEILLVEDDPGDVMYTREVFAEHRIRNRLTVLTDGLDAVSYLRREGRFADAPRPDVVLLDLNLPGLDGRTVLEIIRADPQLSDIVVIVLTGSRLEERMLRDFGVQAEHYICKPVDFDRLVEVVRRIDTFYLQVERVPG
jgi:CheY-like chemotaxis protein